MIKLKWSQLILEGVSILSDILIASESDPPESDTAASRVCREKEWERRRVDARKRIIRGLCMPSAKIGERVRDMEDKMDQSKMVIFGHRLKNGHIWSPSENGYIWSPSEKWSYLVTV